MSYMLNVDKHYCYTSYLPFTARSSYWVLYFQYWHNLTSNFVTQSFLPIKCIVLLKSVTELQRVIYHMRSHCVICHLTHACAPP